MSDTKNFTVEENLHSTRASIRMLLRLLASLPLLRICALPSLMLAFCASLLPPVFLWAVGEFASGKPQANLTLPMFPALSAELPISLKMLAVLLLTSMIVRVLCWIVYEGFTQWSMQSLHARLLHALSKVRVTYFDENPSARILNRIVGDYSGLRDYGVVRIGDMVQALVDLFCIGVLVLYAGAWAAALLVPALIALFYIQIQVGPMLQRLGVMKSIRSGNLLHRETDFIEGAGVFLLYGKISALAATVHQAAEEYGRHLILKFKIEAWSRFWTNAVGSLYAAVGMLAVVFAASQGAIGLVVAATIISVLFRISPAFTWLSWTSLYLGESVGQSRRVFELIDLPREETEEMAQKRTQIMPTPVDLHGDLEFVSYRMSYRHDTPLILDGVSMTFPKGSKVGIVGRTGAGKSSIVQSLLRMVYVRGGDIKVNGHSLFSLPIEQARELFSLVPQEPYLFEGSVASNLDPYGQYQRAQLIEALKEVGFSHELELPLYEGGSNLSFGERQLICLARALLTNRPYVIMDEPTSGVDVVTDSQIQRVLEQSFRGKTIITIAHRPETLARYDLVIEMAEGKVVWEGRPGELDKF